MGVKSIGTTYVITVPNDSILLYISEIELAASTFVFYRHFEEFNKYNILPADELLG